MYRLYRRRDRRRRGGPLRILLDRYSLAEIARLGSFMPSRDDLALVSRDPWLGSITYRRRGGGCRGARDTRNGLVLCLGIIGERHKLPRRRFLQLAASAIASSSSTGNLA